jgi:hypothetical protein
LSDALVDEKGLLPKKPRYADSGEGWADSITLWLGFLMSLMYLS